MYLIASIYLVQHKLCIYILKFIVDIQMAKLQRTVKYVDHQFQYLQKSVPSSQQNTDLHFV
jgi:hypothetical protein